MPKDTGITQRSHEDRFRSAFSCTSDHMSAYSCLGMRSASYHRGFTTPSGQWLEVWWTTDTRTGAVTDIFEDTRWLNRS
jgi:hypothetical protein